MVSRTPERQADMEKQKQVEWEKRQQEEMEKQQQVEWEKKQQEEMEKQQNQLEVCTGEYEISLNNTELPDLYDFPAISECANINDLPTEVINHVSPLHFRTNLKSKGRPKKSRNGLPQFNKKSSDKSAKEGEPKSRRGGGQKRKFIDVMVENNSIEVSTPSSSSNNFQFNVNHTPISETPPQPIARKGRGRPKGSKNNNAKRTKLTVSQLQRDLGMLTSQDGHCPVCRQSPFSGGHQCTLCRKYVHRFCGNGVGEENFGQKVNCFNCVPRNI